MRSRTLFISAALLAFTLATRPASAQYGAGSLADPATGERYHVEVAGALWSPSPRALISSEALGLRGTSIDFGRDFGITRKSFPELRIVLRPATKHKFRLQYTPIKYEARSTLTRDLVFNGLRYRIGIPVSSTIDWKAWRFGYEYDFIYRDRWFAGFIAEAKYSNVRVDLNSPVTSGFAAVKAPIPALGGIGRVYVVPNISITGELTGFKLPDSIDANYSGRYLDFDLYGTVNFTDHVGVQAGYRSLDVVYVIDLDSGDLNLKGFYFTGVVRF